MAIANIAKTSYGPHGRDKMIVYERPSSSSGSSHSSTTSLGTVHSREIVCTNDGHKFMQALGIEHPIGRALVQLSMAQDVGAGDGTTSVVVLAGALCRAALDLVQDSNAHPIAIVRGFNRALELALAALSTLQIPLIDEKDQRDDGVDLDSVRGVPTSRLLLIARSTLASKIADRFSEKFARLCVDAVSVAARHDAMDIADQWSVEWISRPGGSLGDSFLVQGVVLERPLHHATSHVVTTTNPSHNISDNNGAQSRSISTVAVLSCPLDLDKPRAKCRVTISSSEELQATQRLRVELAHRVSQQLQDLQVSLVLCQWSIDPAISQTLWRDARIACVSWIDGHMLERAAVATRARVCPSLTLLSRDYLGQYDLVCVAMISARRHHSLSLIARVLRHRLDNYLSIPRQSRCS